MSLRPIKHFGTGAFKELLLSEEDYLAYRAGVHLGKTTPNDLSALSLNDQATLVGRYEDTYHTSGTESPPTAVISRNYEVILSSNPAGSTHSVTFDDLYIPPPTVVYVGDRFSITVIGNAISTGSGLDEIEYQFGVTGNAGYNLRRLTPDPAATNIDGFQVTWEDYENSSLTGLYQATYLIEVTSTGILNLSLNATSTDLNNATSSATDSIVFNSIRVEPNERPLTGSDVYELYQNDESVASPSTDTTFKKNPFYWDRTASPAGLKEMSDAELDIVCERLLAKIFTNDYPGTFRLSSESPGEDYAEFLPDIFTDTRGDGSTITYSIWVKQSGASPSIPSRVNPVYPFRLNGVFAGIRELSDAEVEFTFGERMKKLIQDTGIGTYRLRSSFEGPPTEAGIWVAKGSAVDTMLSFKESQDYIGLTPFEIQYTAEYVRTYEGDYEVDYIPDYEGIYVGDYLADYAAEYVGDYQGDYIGTYQGDYISDTLVNYETDYIQNYLGNFEVPYIGDFLVNYIEQVYEGDTLIEYLGDYISVYISEYIAETAVDYLGNFTSIYQSVESTDYQGDYLTSYTEDYDSGAEITYEGNFTTNYTGDDLLVTSEEYLAEYQATYLSESSEFYTAEYAAEPFSLGIEEDYSTLYVGDYVGSYVGTYSTLFVGDYIATYLSDYIQEIDYISGSESFSVVSGASVFFEPAGEGDLQIQNYTFSGTLSGSGQVADGVPGFGEEIGNTGYYRGNSVGPDEYEVLTLSAGDVYTAEITYTGDAEVFTQSYSTSYEEGYTTVGYSGPPGGFTYAFVFANPGYNWYVYESGVLRKSGFRQENPPLSNKTGFSFGFVSGSAFSGFLYAASPGGSSGSCTTSPSGTLTPNVTYTQSYITAYTGDFIANFEGDYIGDYEGTYEGTYSGSYEGTYTGTYFRLGYVPDYLTDYEGNFQFPYEGDYIAEYTGDVTTLYASTDYLGDYVSDYIGDVAGVTYTGDYITSYEGAIYTGDIISEYVGDYISLYTGDFTTTYTEEAYLGNFQSAYEGNFQVPYVQNYVGNFTETYIDESATIDYIEEAYTAEYEANFEGVSYQGNYFGTYEGVIDQEEYASEYVGNSYETDYSGEFEGAAYIGEYQTGYEGEPFERNYSNPYTVNEVEVSYTDDETISSRPITIETYTLYVRTANEVTTFSPLGADALITLDGLTLVVR